MTDRVSGFLDDKKQTQCHKEVAALDTRALYEKVEMLQNQNDELRQRIGALEAENKRQMVRIAMKNRPQPGSVRKV